jgi:cytochrome c553
VIGRIALALLAALASGSATARAAEEPPPGAAACSGCHSAKAATAVPPLAGRDGKDLLEQMEAFRSGQRPATVMTRLMKGFTPDEMRAIASWYAAQK